MKDEDDTQYELLSDVPLWTHRHRHTSVGRSARTYLLHFCADNRRRQEDLLEAIQDINRKRGEKQHEFIMVIYLIGRLALHNHLTFSTHGLLN